MPAKTISTVILGGSGYVSAELIRLVLSHPSFRLDAAVSSSHQGERLDEMFTHLAGAAEDMTFAGIEALEPILANKRQVALFLALQHGETASALQLMGPSLHDAVKVVDVSADFRLANPDTFAEVYGQPHGAPELYSKFHCGLPDLESDTPDAYISHPGCFTTCVTLGSAPLAKLSLLASPHLTVSAVTGSSGAGRQPRAGTHHPQRQSALWAYEPLRHRHIPEMQQLLGVERIDFVPHSGPFSRGIHSTIFADLKQETSTENLVTQYTEFYKSSPFISVGTRLPSVKEIVGSNRCHIGISVDGKRVVVTSVIDNLVKGAAGGAVQWMNRLFGLSQDTGLTAPMPGYI